MQDLSPDSIRIGDYTYELPGNRIARFPAKNREESMLLCYDRGNIFHMPFPGITSMLVPGELVIFNNTRVIRARIIMHKDSGARIEIFLLEPLLPFEYSQVFGSGAPCRWKCITGNKKKWKSRSLTRRMNADGIEIRLEASVVKDHGPWQEIEFNWSPASISFGRLIELAGVTPIPPYLERMPDQADSVRYQTVYSRYDGSVAAPTAGLHFTADILDDLRKSGIYTDEITLHVGAGTFQPVKSVTADGHQMHSEHFSVSRETIKAISKFSDNLTAVGTTSVRTIESLYWLGVKLIQNKKSATGSPLLLNQWEHTGLRDGIPPGAALDAILDFIDKKGWQELQAKTGLMITPGYRFRLTKKLITNFHQPGSTLLLLIAAFVGDDWRRIYNYALDNNFRFLSYGDSSILIPRDRV